MTVVSIRSSFHFRIFGYSYQSLPLDFNLSNQVSSAAGVQSPT